MRSRKRKMEAMWTAMLVAMLCGRVFGSGVVLAAGSSMPFVFCTDTGKSGVWDTFSDVLDVCRQQGGRITAQADCSIVPEKEGSSVRIPEKVTVVVPKTIQMTVRNVRIWVDGVLQVDGTVILSDKGEVICGEGKVVLGPEGILEKGSLQSTSAQEEQKEVKNQGTTKVEGERAVSGTKLLTKTVSKPSKIYTTRKKFTQKRPHMTRVVRDKKQRSAVLSWSVVSGKTGYQIRYYASRSARKATTRKTKKQKITLKKLKKNQIYIIRVRAYRDSGKKRTYTKWSPLRKI